MYQTKVMKPVNLKGLSAAKEALEQAFVEAENNGMSGDITVTAIMKSGGCVSVREARNKTVPLPENNN